MSEDLSTFHRAQYADGHPQAVLLGGFGPHQVAWLAGGRRRSVAAVSGRCEREGAQPPQADADARRRVYSQSDPDLHAASLRFPWPARTMAASPDGCVNDRPPAGRPQLAAVDDEVAADPVPDIGTASGLQHSAQRRWRYSEEARCFSQRNAQGGHDLGERHRGWVCDEVCLAGGRWRVDGKLDRRNEVVDGKQGAPVGE